MQDEQAIGLAERSEHRFAIPRDEGAKIDDLKGTTLLIQSTSLLKRPVDARAVCHNGCVLPLVNDACPAELDLIRLVRHLALQ